jgi:hypothetical protein
MSRRSSSSSVNTVTNQSVSRIRGKATDPCSSCKRLLFDSLATQTESQASRVFTNGNDLQSFAKVCPMCRLLWHVLRGADNAQIEQILNYGNNNFNNVGLYLPDGGTDIE